MTEEIREILVKRIDEQKQATGIVVGAIEPAGRRVVACGNLANGDPRTLDGNTIFEIGSISKVFTSLILADMVQRREVALDDPAARYLPERVRMPEWNGKSITLLDLSTHSSGLPRLPGNLKVTDPANPYAGYRADDLYQFLSGYTLQRAPGSEFEYSNLGAGLLGHLLAYRAGMDYESLLRSRITQPLGLLDTGITLSSSMKQRMAIGHNMRLEPVSNWDFSTLAGAGALRSSANDMLTFIEAFLGYKQSALAPAMKAMLNLRRAVGKGSISLGWFVFPTDNREIANHDGGTGGFCSWAGYNPKDRTGAVVLSNAYSPTGVVDIGFHLLAPKWPLASFGIHLDPTLLDNYTGRYQLPGRFFEITRAGARLFAQGYGQQGIGGPIFEMFAESEKNFFVKETGSRFTF